jgi:hypothetical protein
MAAPARGRNSPGHFFGRILVGLERRGRSIPAAAGWALFAVVAIEIVVTYSRIPAHELYHVSGTGITAGLGRALVFLNFPVALIALPLVALAAARLPERRLAIPAAVLAGALSAVVVWPGVVDQGNLDAKPINAVPAIGVALAVLIVAASGLARVRARIDWFAGGAIGLLLLLASPWIAAELGFFLDDVPILGSIFITGKLVAGHPAVHHGHHHGMDGTLLVLAALATLPALRLARAPVLRTAVTAYLGLQVSYGLANIANDDWLEQVVKRGWTSVEIPNVLRPGLTLAWLGIVCGAAGFALLIGHVTK